jgi:hypothetical protein
MLALYLLSSVGKMARRTTTAPWKTESKFILLIGTTYSLFIIAKTTVLVSTGL